MNIHNISILNQKGKTGKTIACSYLGIRLARQVKPLLFVDTDLWRNFSTHLVHPQQDKPVFTLTRLSPDTPIIHTLTTPYKALTQEVLFHEKQR